MNPPEELAMISSALAIIAAAREISVSTPQNPNNKTNNPSVTPIEFIEIGRILKMLIIEQANKTYKILI